MSSWLMQQPGANLRGLRVSASARELPLNRPVQERFPFDSVPIVQLPGFEEGEAIYRRHPSP